MFESFIKFLHSKEFWGIALPFLIALILAFISHQFAVSRKLNEQRKEKRIEYLTGSFNSLMHFSNNPNKAEADISLRNAVIQIQFQGNPSQVNMMKRLLENLGKNKSADFGPLIDSIRDELRKELGLEKVGAGVYWFHPLPPKAPKK